MAGKKSVSFLSNKSGEADHLRAKAGKVTQESVGSTRRMVKLVDECQDAGINTLLMLNTQGESLNRSEAALDEIHNNLEEGDSHLKNIERMEKVPCLCLPCYMLCCRRKKNKKTKPAKNAATKSLIEIENNDNLPPTSSPVMNSNSGRTGQPLRKNGPRINPAIRRHTTNNGGGDDGIINMQSSIQPRPIRSHLPSDRFVPRITGGTEEAEMDSNLTYVSSHVSNLKGQAILMGSTVEQQNAQIGRMNVRTSLQRSKVAELNGRTSKLINNSGSSSKTATSCPCPCSYF